MSTYQSVSPFETPVFLLLVIFAVVCLVRLVYLAIRRRPVRPTVNFVMTSAAAYVLALLAVGLTSREVDLTPGTAKCFDDWCASPMTVERTGRLVIVDLHVSSIARGEAQRPDEPRVSLVGDDGRTYLAAPDALASSSGSERPLDDRIDPGESYSTKLAFEIPAAVRAVKVVVEEGPPWLTVAIIGDEDGILHKKAVYPMPVGGGLEH
jgi:hypothetical protein